MDLYGDIIAGEVYMGIPKLKCKGSNRIGNGFLKLLLSLGKIPTKSVDKTVTLKWRRIEK